ncbi:DUF5302 domain-containing protein [Georgenia wangjunii]|uniref:DUF5302 domain-containing protein n=1 Tax=Georgenia wangjunii TaxID=3117730 RepID=UPI002F265997
MQDETPEPTEAVADAKEKMRAALDRKRAVEHRTAEGRKNTGSVHGSEVGTAATKRMFRRKSG